MFALYFWAGVRIVLSMNSAFELVLIVTLSAAIIAVVISMKTSKVYIKDEWLVNLDFFGRRKVYLPDLKEVEAYLHELPGKTRLIFTDNHGNTLTMMVGHFGNKELVDIFGQLHPYVFRERVDKNFINFDSFIAIPAEGPKIPPQKPLQVLSGVALKIMLPALIITLLLFAVRLIFGR